MNGKKVSASERVRKQEGITWESIPKVSKVDSQDKDSNFETNHKSDGKTVHVDVDEQNTGSDIKNLTLVLLPNRLGKNENNNNGEIGVRSNSSNRNSSVRRSYRRFRPAEGFDNIPCF